MAIIKILKRRYRKKKEQQKSQALKKEYAKYRNIYLGTDQPKKKMQTYAQWVYDKYGKYEKSKPVTKSKSKPVSKTKTGPSETYGTAANVLKRNLSKEERQKLGY